MIFQIFLLIIIASILLVGLKRAQKHQSSPGARIVWLVFWIGAAVIVLRPEIASRAAQFVGVGRGADLVLYLAILVLTALVFTLLFWVDSIEESVTTIVREMALKQYEQSKHVKKGSDSHPHV